jgi:glyoxylase-like metal-dependent hydrolase (beta-lactamase superfamily II)
MMNRRQVFEGAMAGAVALWAPRWARAAQNVRPAGATRLTDRIAVVDAGTNVVAFSTGDGLLLVDSGAPGSGERLSAGLGGLGGSESVHTVFNTHYHLDQTGNNELFTGSGARIIAHDRTRHWMSTDYWLPSENRYERARPEAAWPTEVFFNRESMEAGGETIDYGFLVVAHTGGDIYVHFRDANVLAVGDVASPVKDPELDWITGAWIGGRVDAMDLLLEIADEDTRIVPGTGPVMTYADFQAEREMMEVVRQRLFGRIRLGDGPQDMLEGGVLDELPRTWEDPYTFLYAAARGLWGNHNKLDPNVV